MYGNIKSPGRTFCTSNMVGRLDIFAEDKFQARFLCVVAKLLFHRSALTNTEIYFLRRVMKQLLQLRNLPKKKRIKRACRECGCTDLDCRNCIKRTGYPCYWVEKDLCSACVPPPKPKKKKKKA